MEAVGTAARAIRAGEMDFAIAGGVESMTRAPFVQGKSEEAFSRKAEIYDTTIGWRFINPLMKAQYGVDSMPETGENVAEDYQVTPRRSGRLRLALAAARRPRRWPSGYFAKEIVAVEISRPQRRNGQGRQGRASASRHHARTTRQTEDAVPQSRHGHRRQCLRHQRRRRSLHRRLGSGGEGAWTDATRAHSRHGLGRGAAAHHGHRPGAGDAAN